MKNSGRFLPPVKNHWITTTPVVVLRRFTRRPQNWSSTLKAALRGDHKNGFAATTKMVDDKQRVNSFVAV